MIWPIDKNLKKNYLFSNKLLGVHNHHCIESNSNYVDPNLHQLFRVQLKKHLKITNKVGKTRPMRNL